MLLELRNPNFLSKQGPEIKLQKLYIVDFNTVDEKERFIFTWEKSFTYLLHGQGKQSLGIPILQTNTKKP